jgi:hydrogenase-4 component E
MVRYFTLSSICLAAIIGNMALTTGETGEYWAFFLTVFFKIILIPYLIATYAKKAGVSYELKGYTGAATSLFLGGIILFGSYFVTNILPPLQIDGTEATNVGEMNAFLFKGFLFVAVSLIFIGLLILIIRRDIYSQIIGLLTLENGIATFGIIAVGGIPFLMETGVFLVIVLSVIIMAILSHQVQEFYGTTDTKKLSELID